MQTASRNSGQVRSLTRALSILESLAHHPEGMSLTELSDATDLPPSTTHRLLTTLEAERFVRPDPNGGLWRIGVAAFFVGSAFARSRDTLSLVRPYLKRLMEVSGETANLFVESDGEAVCIGQIESRHAMRAITGIGGRIMLHSSAAGKVLMAFADSKDYARLQRQADYAAVNERNGTTRDALRAQLEQIRASGYATDDEAHAVGLRCVAAPVFNEFGEAVAAISVSGPKARITDERLPLLGRMVTQAAAEATRDYGGSMPKARTGS